MALDPILQRLAEIRRSFDASFAEKARPHEDARRSVLAIRAGASRFAVRAAELARVEACRAIVKLPASLPGLLGVTGIRGRLLAAYELGALLGEPSAASRGDSAKLRWLLVPAVDPTMGLVIEEVEAFVRVTAADFKPMAQSAAGGHLVGLLQQGELQRSVVDVAALAGLVARRAEESREGRRQR